MKEKTSKLVVEVKKIDKYGIIIKRICGGEKITERDRNKKDFIDWSNKFFYFYFFRDLVE